jgi:AcrR family transcriptional regulator
MQEQRSTKRQEQALQTKRNLYCAALELIKEKHFDKISIEEISKKAGVSVGSFYYYFGSKEEIYINLFKQMDEHLYGSGQTKDEAGHVQDRVLDFFVQFARHTAELGVHLNKQLYQANNKLLTCKGSHMRKRLRELIVRGQAKNEWAHGRNEEEIADYLLMMARGIVFDWCLHDGGYQLEEVMLRYMREIIHSLGLPERHH